MAALQCCGVKAQTTLKKLKSNLGKLGSQEPPGFNNEARHRHKSAPFPSMPPTIVSLTG
jgi:hypothetical protein